MSTFTIPPPSISGLVYGLPLDEYHGDQLGRAYISKSGMDILAKSPAHFYARHLDPGRPPRPDPTPAMMLGTLTHCSVLEPDKFDERYVVAPACDRRTKIGKADWSAFQSSLAPGQEAVDGEMCYQAHEMGKSIRANEALANLLNEGDAEVSAFGLDATTGVAVRVRPDFVSTVNENAVILVDVKTCLSASPEDFAKTVVNYGYARQASLYTDVYGRASGKEVRGFVFAAVEKEPPFACAAYMLPEEWIVNARNQNHVLLHRYAECLRTGEWPGYINNNEIRVLTPPAWALKD